MIADAKARSGRAMRFFKTDGDGIFTGDAAAEIYRKHAIRHTMSAPGDSSSNDIAERTIRTFAELLRTNLMHANAPASFWVEALGMIEYVWNHLAVIQVADGTYLSRTSILEGHQRQYDLNVLRAFGTKCHFLLTPQKKGGLKLALEAKGRLGIILGIEDNMPAYRVYDLSKRRVARIPFAQLISHEGHFPFRDRSLWSDEDQAALPFMLLPEEVHTEVQEEAIEEVTLTVEPTLVVSKAKPVTRPTPTPAPTASTSAPAASRAPTAPAASAAPPLVVSPPQPPPEVPNLEVPPPVGDAEDPMDLDAAGTATPATRYDLRARRNPVYFPPPQLHRRPMISRTCLFMGPEQEQTEECCTDSDTRPRIHLLPLEGDAKEVEEHDGIWVHTCTEACTTKYLSSVLLTSVRGACATPATSIPIVGTDPATKPVSIPAPANRREALKSPWWQGYYNAELVEMQSHAKNGTWKLVPRSEVPPGYAILRDRWAYSDKLTPNGVVVGLFKARLTAMGCFQQPGKDYTDTYASVMTTHTFRLLLQL